MAFLKIVAVLILGRVDFAVAGIVIPAYRSTQRIVNSGIVSVFCSSFPSIWANLWIPLKIWKIKTKIS